MSEGMALNWDDAIEHDGDTFTLLPDGTEADFEVLELAKATSKSEKLGQPPMAKLKLRVFNEHGSTIVNENLVLHTSCEWKLCEFFRAIGQRKHGERFIPRWKEVPGSKGRCRVTVDRFKKRNGEEAEVNKIKHYLEPVPVGPEF